MPYLKHIRLRFIKYLLTGILMITACLVCMQAQTNLKKKREELEKQRLNIVNQINQTKKTLDENKKLQHANLNQLNTIEAQIKLRENLIDVIGQEIFQISLEIQNQQQIIELLQNDIERIKSDYAQHIVAAYKIRNSADKLMFILNAKDFNQAWKRIKYLNQYNNYRQKQAMLILKTKQAMNQEVNKLIAIKREKMNLIGIKEVEKVKLEKDKNEKKEVLTKLQQNEKQLRAELARAEKAAQKLNTAIKELIAKEIAEAKKAEEARRKSAEAKSNKSNVAKADTKTTDFRANLSPEMFKLSTDFENNRGKLPWPVDNGYISETFGVHAHPTLKGVKTFNNGINIATSKGSAIRTIFKGTVKAIFSVPGMEKVILINHGEYYSVYANLESVNVKIGQEVKTGDLIGYVYTNEELNKTELHLEIYRQKEMQNPTLWLKN